jgi:hypothetical protein
MSVIKPMPIPKPRRDGSLDPKELESWQRNTHQILSSLAAQIAAVLTQGEGITLTVAGDTIVITLRKIAISTDAPAITAATVAGTAGGTYTGAEQSMINSLVAQHNALLTDAAAIRAALNDLKAKARTAKHLSV